MNYSIPFVVLFGMSTVFLGLCAIILLTMAISRCVRFFEDRQKAAAEAAQKTAQPAEPEKTESQPAEEVPAREDMADAEQISVGDLQEVMAAVIATVAMEENVEFEQVKVLSFKEA